MDKLQRSLKMLRSKDERKHQEAQEVFFEMFGEEAGEAIRALIPLLSHRQLPTRAAVLRCIRSLGEFSFLGSGRFEALGPVDREALFSALLLALANKDYQVHEEAKSVWIRFAWRERESVIVALRRGFNKLSDREKEVRGDVFAAIKAGGLAASLARGYVFSSRREKSIAARHVSENASKKTVRWLKRWLRDDPDRACYDATYALGRIGTVEAVRVLMGFVTHHEWRVRAAVVSALGTSISKITMLSVDGEEQQSIRKRGALGASDVKEVIALLLGALQDEDMYVESYAIDVLGAMKAKEAVEPLLEIVGQEWNLCRAQAVRALGDLGDPQAIKPLLGMLQHPEEELRSAAAYALGCLEAVEAVEPLLGLLHDPSESVREAVVSALGGMGRSGGERVISSLLGALSDGVASIRLAALRTLAQLGAKESVGGLIAFLDDPSQGLRVEAIQALGRLCAKEAITPRPDQSEQTIESKEIVAALLARWDGESEFVQGEIGIALGKIGEKEQAKRLLPLLRSPHIQGNIVSALIQMGAFPADSARSLLWMWEETIRALPEHAYFLWRDEENIPRLTRSLEILQEEAKDETKPHAAEEWLSWQVHLGRYLPVFIEPLREMRRAWFTSKKQRDQESYKQSQKISDALERLLWLFQQEAAQQFAKDAEDALF